MSRCPRTNPCRTSSSPTAIRRPTPRPTFKYEIFRPDTRTYRCGEYDIETPAKPDPRHLRITRRGSNASDPEQVGDIIAISSEFAPHGSIPHTVEVADSKGVRLEDISVYASNCFGFLEYNCDGTTYYRCKVDRRPPATDLVQRADPRIRSLNADAFHSICAVKGPAYIECAARFMGDDCINIHGDYHLVTASTAQSCAFLSKQRGGINIAAGDEVELLSYDGLRLPDAMVASVEPDAEVNEAEKQFLSRNRAWTPAPKNISCAPRPSGSPSTGRWICRWARRFARPLAPATAS